LAPLVSRAWILQATPRRRNLAAELRATDTLAWSVARYGRELTPGDRVYYWQAGRDAGIYGVGAVDEVVPRGPDRRYTVRTRHERALFVPLARDDLRADPVLRDIPVLRQPRGTAFPLTPAQAAALARRTGAGRLVLALPVARRVKGELRLYPGRDGEVLAAVVASHARSDELVVALVPDLTSGEDTAGRDMAGDSLPEPTLLRVDALRRGRGGQVVLRTQPMDDQAPSLPPDVLERVRAGHAALVPPVDAALVPPVDAALVPPVDAALVPPVDVGDAVVPPVDVGDAVVPRIDIDDARAGASRVAEEPAPYVAPRFAPSAEDLFGELVLPPAVAAQLVAAVDGGRHIILMGMPGTGKTSLALNLARAAAAAGLCAGPLLATATADWTTFDTVGGLVPGPDGALRFAEGVALRALRENRWLVLDELNRADIDKAFGPLLTVLSGAPVELPAVTVGGRPVRVEPAPGPAALLADGATYRAGSSWRIIGTINTLDRAALFSFSLAFARRFAFVLVPPPDPDGLLALIARRVPLDEPATTLLRRLLAVTPRPLGPAILLDAAAYIAARADPAALAEALGLFVAPQLEGLDRGALDLFVADLSPALPPDGPATLRAYIDAFYGEG